MITKTVPQFSNCSRKSILNCATTINQNSITIGADFANHFLVAEGE